MLNSSKMIGVAGTHSTGKTSFLKSLHGALCDQGFGVGIIGDLGSSAHQKGFPILRDHTFSSTLWIMAKGISLELEAQLRNEVVLVDRPIPDALAYLYAALEFRSEELNAGERHYLEELVRLGVGRYHMVFKTMLDETIPIDTSKPRDLDPGYRKSVDRHMTSVFDRLVPNWRRIEHDKWDETISSCVQQIKHTS